MFSLDIYSSIALFCVIIIGIPHGGLDAAIARQKGWPQSSTHYVVFHLSYLALSITIMYLWYLFPLASLISFLLISGVHFGLSDLIFEKKSNILKIFVHGSLVPIIIPYFNQEDVLDIFTVLIGSNNALSILSLISYLILPWLLCFSLYSYHIVLKKERARPYISLLILIAISYLCPPLVSFSVYFCVFHSPGHVINILSNLDSNERKRALIEAIIYSVITFILMFVGITLLVDNFQISESIIIIIFIGLAALTFPHMILVDYISSPKKY